MTGKAKNLKGKTFGNLKVVERVRRPGYKPHFAYWRCVCSCGREVVKRGDQLRAGYIKSCCVDGHRWGGMKSRQPAPRYIRLWPAKEGVE